MNRKCSFSLMIVFLALSVWTLTGQVVNGHSPQNPAGANQSTIEPDARKAINDGNQAWVDGMKSGQLAPVAATYASDALDCGPTGECFAGVAAIEGHFKKRSAELGRAESASVTSFGAVQQGDLVFEWGRAEALFANNKKVQGNYLTVWQRQPGGGWKIFRNIALPTVRKE